MATGTSFNQAVCPRVKHWLLLQICGYMLLGSKYIYYIKVHSIMIIKGILFCNQLFPT